MHNMTEMFNLETMLMVILWSLHLPNMKTDRGQKYKVKAIFTREQRGLRERPARAQKKAALRHAFSVVWSSDWLQ